MATGRGRIEIDQHDWPFSASAPSPASITTRIAGPHHLDADGQALAGLRELAERRRDCRRGSEPLTWVRPLITACGV